MDELIPYRDKITYFSKALNYLKTGDMRIFTMIEAL